MPRKGIRCGNLEILKQSQLELIHAATMKVLKETGVRVLNNRALAIYAQNGCRVDFEKKQVQIDEKVLLDCIAQAPKQFMLCGKREDYDLSIDCATSYMMGGAAAIRILDMDGTYREPTANDLNNFTRLQDALTNTDIVCPMVIPRDVEPALQELFMSSEVLTNTFKNCDLWIHDPVALKHQIKIAEAITNQRFEERPIYSLCIDLISPLIQPADVTEVMIEAAARGVPIYVEVCDIMGATSPVTIAGTLVQQSANILLGIALAQMVRSGAPCFYSMASSAMNMKHGGYLAGDPATVLLNAATAQVAHYYGLPVNCGTGLDSKLADIQAGYERAFQNMGCVAAGGNIVHLATGMLEQMAMANYELAVIDDEVYGMCKKYFGGIEVTTETMAGDIIGLVSASDHRDYLSESHTYNHFADNFWNRLVTDQESFAAWSSGGKGNATASAKEVARDLVANHRPRVVTESQERVIQGILAQAKEEYFLDAKRRRLA